MGLFDRKQSSTTEKKKRSGRGGESGKERREEREESENEERIERRRRDEPRKPRPIPPNPPPPPPPPPPNPDPYPPPAAQQTSAGYPLCYYESNAATIVHDSSYTSSSSRFDGTSSSAITGATLSDDIIPIRVHGVPANACLNMTKEESFVSKAFAKKLNRVSSKPASNVRTYIDSIGNEYTASHRIAVDVNELRNQYLYVVDGELFQNVVLGTEIASRLQLMAPDSRSSTRDRDNNLYSAGSLPVRGAATVPPPGLYNFAQAEDTSGPTISGGYLTGAPQIQPAVNSNTYSESQSLHSSHMGYTYPQYSQLGMASSATENNSYYTSSSSADIALGETYSSSNYYSAIPKNSTGVSDHFQQQESEGETSWATTSAPQAYHDSSQPGLSLSTRTDYDASKIP